jgi:hypothetical protein
MGEMRPKSRERISLCYNRVVQKLQFLNNNRLKMAKSVNFVKKLTLFWETCERTNRVLEQVQ